jgi:hypothetical protein
MAEVIRRAAVPWATPSRWALDGPSMSAEILRTGRPARVEDYSGLSGTLAAGAREAGFNRIAGAPIIVDGRVWGVISTSSPDEPLPDDVEHRLAAFTELTATAIANSQAREEITRLAEEQAALRRVATLVAEGVGTDELLAAVAKEVAGVVGLAAATIDRYDADGSTTVLAAHGEHMWTVGSRWPVEPIQPRLDRAPDRTSGEDRRLLRAPGHDRRRCMRNR